MISEFNRFAGNKILGWLLVNPDAEIGINELARELGTSPATVMRYSNLFSDSGIVTIEKAGTAHLIGEEQQVDRDKVLEIQEKIGREIQLTLISWHKFGRMKKENDPFIINVIKDHILLSGAEL